MEIITIQSFIDYYEKIRARTNRIIEIVPPEHIDFSYKNGKFTIADQIRHIATIERYMFIETVLGRKSAYADCGKDLADGYENVVKYFNRLHGETLEILKGLSDADLNKKCMTPANSPITVWKWLRAMVEHEIHHRGEIYIYLNLLDVSTPHLFGLSAEKVQEISVNSNKED